MAREMKDSGVEWIGEIPKEWEVVKLKRIVELYVGNSIKDEEKSKYLDNINAIPYISTKDIDIANSTINYENGMYTKIGDSNFRVAKKDSILLCIEGGSAGRKISYLLQDVSFVNKLCCFEGKINVRKKFLYYFLKSESFKSEFFLNISGLIGGVSQNLLKNFFTTLPSLEEQEKIANYLDKKVSDIDLIIEKTKATIEDYKKYKQSIITEAVTKGINPNVEMKDSGIEWIGEIPREWEVKKLSEYFFQVKNKNSNLEEKNLLSLSYGKIIRKDINKTDGLLPENFSNYNIIDKGDIVLRLTDLQNDHKSLRVGLCNEKGIITSAYITLRIRKPQPTSYFYNYIHTYDIHKGFYGMGDGVRQSLTYDGLKSFKIILPSLEEQNQIVEYIDKKISEIDTLITKKEVLIVELEEYKKSLIYECVTGKKEVNENV